MTYEKIKERLVSLSDKNVEQFSKKLIPNIQNVLGIRLPLLRVIAKEIVRDDCTDFLARCDFEFYEEFLLFGIVIAYQKTDTAQKLLLLENFISKIDNWAVNDSVAMSFKFKGGDKELVRSFIEKFLSSDREFALRFAIVLLFTNFVDSDNIDYTLTKLLEVSSEFYYVKMAVAWGLCDCIVKQPQKSIPRFLACKSLDDFTFNKTISKCCDSFRVSEQDKAFLKSKRR